MKPGSDELESCRTDGCHGSILLRMGIYFYKLHCSSVSFEHYFALLGVYSGRNASVKSHEVFLLPRSRVGLAVSSKTTVHGIFVKLKALTSWGNGRTH